MQHFRFFSFPFSCGQSGLLYPALSIQKHVGVPHSVTVDRFTTKVVDLSLVLTPQTHSPDSVLHTLDKPTAINNKYTKVGTVRGYLLPTKLQRVSHSLQTHRWPSRCMSRNFTRKSREDYIVNHHHHHHHYCTVQSLKNLCLHHICSLRLMTDH